MEIKEIIEKISTYGEFFPKEAVEEAIKRKEEIIPELYKILESAIKNGEESDSDDEDYNYTGSVYAMFLLAYFRDKKSFPLISKFILSPPKNDNLFADDLLWDFYPAIIVSVFNADFAFVNSVVENTDNADFTRIVFSEIYAILYLNNEIDRNTLLNAYKSFIKISDTEENLFKLNLLVSAADCYLKELLPDAEKYFTKKFSDKFMQMIAEDDSLKEIKDIFKKTEDEVLKESRDRIVNQKINNVVELLEEWYECYDEESVYDDYDENEDEDLDYEDDNDYEFDDDEEDVDSVKNSSSKIGRNDPCPCGSGKKYKKCCGS